MSCLDYRYPVSKIKKTSTKQLNYLSVLFKLFDKFLLKRLKFIIVSKNIIPDYQFRFRKKREKTSQKIHKNRLHKHVNIEDLQLLDY